MLTTQTNLDALYAGSSAASAQRQIADAATSLSTGKRIGSAGNDATAIAISTRLTGVIMELKQAIRNSLDGEAMLNTAAEAYGGVISNLQRLRELAVQACGDSNATADRTYLNQEAQQLLGGVNQIANATSWAGQNLIDGTFTSKSMQVGAGSGVSSVSLSGASTSDLGLDVATTAPSTSYQVTRATTVTTTPPGTAVATTTTTIEAIEPTAGTSTSSSVASAPSTTTPTLVSSAVVVSTNSSLQKTNPFVSALTNGGYVFAWTSSSQDGSAEGIFGQIYDASGTKSGSEFQLNTWTSNTQDHAKISALS